MKKLVYIFYLMLFYGKNIQNMSEILELHKQGLKIQQIADCLEIPLSTAHYRLHKAIKNEVNEQETHSNSNFQLVRNDVGNIENALETIENKFENTPKTLKNEVFDEKPTHIKIILERELQRIDKEMKERSEETLSQQEDIYYLHTPKLLEFEKKERKLENEVNEYKKILELNDIDFYNLHYPKEKVSKEDFNKDNFFFFFSEKKKNFDKFIEAKNVFFEHFKKLKSELEETSDLIRNKKNEIKQTQDRIKQLQNEWINLEKSRRLLISGSSKRKIKNDVDLIQDINKLQIVQETEKPTIMKGKILANKNFELPIKLVSEKLTNLIAFLGNITREMFFCSITGDAGAGKSEFSFVIAKILAQNKFKILYLSLEMGICAEQQKRLSFWKIQENYFDICERMKIDQLKEVAPDYDVIIIDSYGKLNADVKEIDQLRQDFPKILFFAIFQKTTAGTMRGGAGTLFDSTMNINLKIENDRRIAKMVKSRYGTQEREYIIPVINKK